MRALKRWEACGVDRVNFLLNAMEVIPRRRCWTAFASSRAR
mgnify:CR=1 FL=1